MPVTKKITGISYYVRGVPADYRPEPIKKMGKLNRAREPTITIANSIRAFVSKLMCHL